MPQRFCVRELVLTFGCLAIGPLGARAQGLITQKALSLEMAQAIAQGAVERCRADGFRVSVTVIPGRAAAVRVACRLPLFSL
jgi:hypothetical protein